MKRSSCALLLLLPASFSAAADGPASLAGVFPMEAAIEAPAAGLIRLDLPVEVLASCRQDLSDIRLFDEDGAELPYVIVGPPEGERGLEVVYSTDPEVLAVDRSQRGRPRAPGVARESYLLAVPALPDDATGWNLVMITARPELVLRLDLVAEHADGSRTPLITGGSAFRLVSPAAERLRFPILDPEATRVELTLEGEGQRHLSPAFRLEAVRALRQAAPPVVELEQLSAHQGPERTTVLLQRPRGMVPSRLLVSSTTASFRRSLEVWDEGPGAVPGPLARTQVLRIPSIAPVELLETPLGPARGDRLRVVIDDRSSPPLEHLSFRAVVPQPTLFFALADGRTRAILRFGGARAHRPDYDLEALLPALGRPLAGVESDLAMAFWDPDQTLLATLGPIRANQLYDPAPALAFAMRAGAKLDPEPYSHRRQLQLEPSPEGLARLRLKPDDVALMRADLADLRVVDGASRQWAFLIERRAARHELNIEVAETRHEEGWTRYRLRLPASPLVVSRLVLEPEEPFFDREVTLDGSLGDRRLQLAAGRLVRHHGDPRPVDLAFAETRVDRLSLAVHDGDDSPLTLSRIAASTSLHDLYMAAPTGDYTLLLGFPEARPPSYELERVRQTVLAVPSGEVVAGGLEPNPSFSASSRLIRGGGPQRLLLWAALGLAVVALAGLTLRLARQERETHE